MNLIFWCSGWNWELIWFHSLSSLLSALEEEIFRDFLEEFWDCRTREWLGIFRWDFPISICPPRPRGVSARWSVVRICGSNNTFLENTRPIGGGHYQNECVLVFDAAWSIFYKITCQLFIYFSPFFNKKIGVLNLQRCKGLSDTWIYDVE